MTLQDKVAWMYFQQDSKHQSYRKLGLLLHWCRMSLPGKFPQMCFQQDSKLLS
jgi:hypothetical protein